MLPVVPPRKLPPSRPRPGMVEVPNPFDEQSPFGRGSDEKGNELPVTFYQIP